VILLIESLDILKKLLGDAEKEEDVIEVKGILPGLMHL